jgi:hypothetical protein
VALKSRLNGALGRDSRRKFPSFCGKKVFMKSDSDLAGNIKDRLPIISHESLSADCCGCLYVRVDGAHAAIICNECSTVIRTVPVVDVEAVILEMAQTDVICSALCAHCGTLNTFPGMSSIEAFICSECGEGVVVIPPVS